ncbi:hypothetical protein F0L68_18755 [Solihabitans fulvus]|uniref:Uncharacterized protein n=1 Tax=Solihabitans fulvus TaxID=1892852 RepID=A0A5B2XDR7_9PSEU|nr:hypothetical protein [Solihabitans fulvus]KAA2261101.1 hypothetical protein F0L68_18755 [Solihabitans fulvus]
MTEWRAASVELTRRLTGRLADHVLVSARSLLAADERDVMAGMLVHTLALFGIPVDQHELDLLSVVAGRPDEPVGGVVLEPDAGRLRYRFEPRTPGPPDRDLDHRHVLTWAAGNPTTARRVLLAWREPEDGAPMPPGWIYLLEIAEPGEVAGVQAAVQLTPGAVGVEVMATGEHLPPYQAAVLAAGRQIWP